MGALAFGKSRNCTGHRQRATSVRSSRDIVDPSAEDSRLRLEDDREVVHRHVDNPMSAKTMLSSQGDDILDDPQSPIGVPLAQRCIERGVAGHQGRVRPLEWAIEVQGPSRLEQPLCARDQPPCRRPGADMSHVDAEHGIGLFDGPLRRGGVNPQRRKDVRQARMVSPRLDRGQRMWIACSPLPLATSRTSPSRGSTSRNTEAITSRLRCTDGDCFRTSPPASDASHGSAAGGLMVMRQFPAHQIQCVPPLGIWSIDDAPAARFAASEAVEHRGRALQAPAGLVQPRLGLTALRHEVTRADDHLPPSGAAPRWHRRPRPSQLPRPAGRTIRSESPTRPVAAAIAIRSQPGAARRSCWRRAADRRSAPPRMTR